MDGNTAILFCLQATFSYFLKMCNKHDKVSYNLYNEIYLHAYLHADVSTNCTCVSQIALRKADATYSC